MLFVCLLVVRPLLASKERRKEGWLAVLTYLPHLKNIPATHLLKGIYLIN